MPTYQCSSQCGHCAYFSSPQWDHEFINQATARRALRAIRLAGCTAIHIGGGEPFLGGEQLVELCSWCASEGVGIDYIETNSSWFTNADAARRRLEALAAAGVDTLLVSMSPFHNTFIPWRKVQGVLEACGEVGMGVYPWTEGLGADVASLDAEITHSLDEYEARFGPGYLRSIPGRYWVSPRGRALTTFRPFAGEQTAAAIVTEHDSFCSELYDTGHFHVDLFGNYIPGVCSGLAVDVDDLAEPFDRQRYPFLATLTDGGIAALLSLAQAEYGFEPTRTFSGKCDLCYEIRFHLVMQCGVQTRDLQPSGLYEQMAREGWGGSSAS